VEGHDVQAKIALLAKLAFGVHVPLEQIPTKGISAITRSVKRVGFVFWAWFGLVWFGLVWFGLVCLAMCD
jgi:homoserine dehydrogenase